MSGVWLYTVNPKSPAGYGYAFDVENPESLNRTKDNEWTIYKYRRQIAAGDLMFFHFKNAGKKPDGVYGAGIITEIRADEGSFEWQPDRALNQRLVARPVLTDTVKAFFGRGFGESIRPPLSPKLARRWLALVGRPVKSSDPIPVTPPGSKSRIRHSNWNPAASREHGIIGETHVLQVLRRRFPKSAGFSVTHVAKRYPSSDHDISVECARSVVRIVEVKTTVGSPGDAVIISENELRCRRKYGRRHSIFIVYLNHAKKVTSSLEIGDKDSFELSPRHHFLRPLS
ncbi:MAG: DUF3883 domain-containing protein [Planctomycetes bacterium]|nr:DUF3883 domain-containing protein [Planctomycetota bacterium]